MTSVEELSARCADPVLAAKRELAIARYSLDDPASWEAVQPCINIAWAHFKMPVFVSVVHDDYKLVIGSVQSIYKPGQTVTNDLNLCSKAVTAGVQEALEIVDTRLDRRTAALKNLPVYYLGQPVLLTPAADEDPVPVCTLCLHSDKPTTMDKEGLQFLTDLAGVMRHELKNRWHMERQAKSAEMEKCIQDILQPITAARMEERSSAVDTYSNTAECVRKHLDSDYVAILDLSAFETVWSRVIPTPEAVVEQSDAGWLGRPPRQHIEEGKAVLLALSFSEAAAKDKINYSDPLVLQALAACLKAQRTEQSRRTGGAPSGALRVIFPCNSQAYIAVALYLAGKPDLFFLVSSFTPHKVYEREHTIFVSNVAALLQSQLNSSRLDEVDRAKTQFVANVSHELRTPLYGLLSQLELLQDVLSPDKHSEVAPLLETAEVCGMTLKDILEAVLSFGKMDSRQTNGIAPTHHDAIDLCRIVSETINLVYTRSSRIHSVKGKKAPLPELSAHIEEPWDQWMAAVDAAALRRILINLVSNSLKYTEKGSITVTLRSLDTPPHCASQGMTLVQFVVLDTGIGISEEFQKKLFTPFLQENAFASGAGLGLNMVQSLIKSMDGDIAIRSTLGQGTEVKVNLPVRMSRPRPPKTRLGPVTFYSSARDLSVLEAYSAASLSPRLGNAGLSSSAPPSFGPPRSTCRKLRVLVIDDNKISRKVLTTVMSRKGVDCREAEDGQEGLDIFQTWRPHLVFTDVSMPIMDGVELARRIRELERKEDAAHPTYIVALTGLSQSTVHEDLRGIDEWFTKGGQTTLKTLSNVVDRIQARIQDDGRTA